MSMISCLMVTQVGRLALLRRAVSDFARQTWRERELHIVHDGGAAYQRVLEGLQAEFPAAPICIHEQPPGQRLGALRNASLDLATGSLVCQWDDDDRYHPQRLACQVQALQAQDADACFLVDQLHLFEQDRLLYWDDWSLERYPYNLIPGTLLARRASMPRYVNWPRGEDSALVDEMLRTGVRLARLKGMGWLYVYGYSGLNTFEAMHHQAISKAKPLRATQVLAQEKPLREALRAYDPPLGPLSLVLPSCRLQL